MPNRGFGDTCSASQQLRTWNCGRVTCSHYDTVVSFDSRHALSRDQLTKG